MNNIQKKLRTQAGKYKLKAGAIKYKLGEGSGKHKYPSFKL